MCTSQQLLLSLPRPLIFMCVFLSHNTHLVHLWHSSLEVKVTHKRHVLKPQIFPLIRLKLWKPLQRSRRKSTRQIQTDAVITLKKHLHQPSNIWAARSQNNPGRGKPTASSTDGNSRLEETIKVNDEGTQENQLVPDVNVIDY